ncbi:MAG: serine/threonine-protein kinase [Planctomycetaceae bacterium]
MHPDKIGPFLTDRKIGSGGMGNVYHGVHETTGQEVAVKVLSASMAHEEGFVQRFSREIHALSKLSSRNIVTLYDDGETPDGSYYYAMEFVDGETLTALVSREKRLPWKQVIDISLQIAAALKAAHDAGIVHRDLKPSNLMIAKDGTVKLTDFGVAHVFATTRLTRTGGVVGTAEYMSPEQARGHRATKRSDLYSLGAVMYVMLTGRPPFTGKIASEVLHQHQFAQFDKPSHYVPELPRLLEEVVCTLMEKKPDKRFPDALVLIRKLENVRGRIEYQESLESETAVAADRLSDHTSALADDQTQGGTLTSTDHRGPATMIRDQIRQQIDAELHKSAVGKFFDNTYVLIALLVAVIFVGWYLSRASIPDPADQYVQAERIMSAKAGTSWIRARNDLLEPLLKDNVLPERRDQIALWIDQVNQYEFCRGLKLSDPSDASEQSEMQRLVRRAFERYAAGDILPATQQLQAVRTLIDGQDQYAYLADFITATLDNWSANKSNAARQAVVEEIIERAKRLLSEGQTDDAVQTLNAANVLYQHDAAVQPQLIQIRDLLKSVEQPAAEVEPQANNAEEANGRAIVRSVNPMA